jgi:hypothetical protein
VGRAKTAGTRERRVVLNFILVDWADCEIEKLCCLSFSFHHDTRSIYTYFSSRIQSLSATLNINAL